MCMEDVRLARQTGSVVNSVTIGATGVATLVNADPHRLSLTIGVPTGVSVYVSPGSTPPSDTFGFPVNSANATKPYTLDEWGQALLWQWSVFGAVGTVVTYCDTGLLRD